MTPDPISIPEIDSNIRLLRASGNESAILCASEAAGCVLSHEDGLLAHPNESGSIATLPASWLASAARWCERGAQHAWGWPHQRPEGWISTGWEEAA